LREGARWPALRIPDDAGPGRTVQARFINRLAFSDAGGMTMRALVPALVVALAFGGAMVPGPASAADPDALVHISNFAFSPRNATIQVGQTVQWDNQDFVMHTATADDDSWDSGTLGPGATFSYTFTTAGSFPYRCLVHGTMHGRVVVLDPANLPDVAVGSVVSTELTPAYQSRIDVVVRNLGTGEAPEEDVTVAYVYHGTEHPIGVATAPAIPAGGSATVSVAWNTLGKVGDFVLVARADSTDVLAEPDEANNVGQGVGSVLLPPGLLDGIDLLEPI